MQEASTPDRECGASSMASSPAPGRRRSSTTCARCRRSCLRNAPRSSDSSWVMIASLPGRMAGATGAASRCSALRRRGSGSSSGRSGVGNEGIGQLLLVLLLEKKRARARARARVGVDVGVDVGVGVGVGGRMFVDEIREQPAALRNLIGAYRSEAAAAALERLAALREVGAAGA